MSFYLFSIPVSTNIIKYCIFNFRRIKTRQNSLLHITEAITKFYQARALKFCVCFTSFLKIGYCFSRRGIMVFAICCVYSGEIVFHKPIFQPINKVVYGTIENNHYMRDFGHYFNPYWPSIVIIFV